MVVIDKMAITPKKAIYNPSTKTLQSKVTIPNTEGLGTHVLVFIVSRDCFQMETNIAL